MKNEKNIFTLDRHFIKIYRQLIYSSASVMKYNTKSGKLRYWITTYEINRIKIKFRDIPQIPIPRNELQYSGNFDEVVRRVFQCI